MQDLVAIPGEWKHQGDISFSHNTFHHLLNLA